MASASSKVMPSLFLSLLTADMTLDILSFLSHTVPMRSVAPFLFLLVSVRSF